MRVTVWGAWSDSKCHGPGLAESESESEREGGERREGISRKALDKEIEGRMEFFLSA
jgi:hypothetical protein